MFCCGSFIGERSHTTCTTGTCQSTWFLRYSPQRSLQRSTHPFFLSFFSSAMFIDFVKIWLWFLKVAEFIKTEFFPKIRQNQISGRAIIRTNQMYYTQPSIFHNTFLCDIPVFIFCFGADCSINHLQWRWHWTFSQNEGSLWIMTIIPTMYPFKLIPRLDWSHVTKFRLTFSLLNGSLQQFEIVNRTSSCRFLTQTHQKQSRLKMYFYIVIVPSEMKWRLCFFRIRRLTMRYRYKIQMGSMKAWNFDWQHVEGRVWELYVLWMNSVILYFWLVSATLQWTLQEKSFHLYQWTEEFRPPGHQKNVFERERKEQKRKKWFIECHFFLVVWFYYKPLLQKVSRPLLSEQNASHLLRPLLFLLCQTLWMLPYHQSL